MKNVMSEEPADKKRKPTPRPITAKARTLPLKTRRLLRMTGRTARTAMPPKRAARRSSS